MSFVAAGLATETEIEAGTHPTFTWMGLTFNYDTMTSTVVAIVIVLAMALVARATGMLSAEMVTAPRPNTGFIWRPDRWSFIVALIAGAVGALALALDKTSTMVGVFISVTTVPAAGNLALGLAFLSGTEIAGSAEQLAVNIAGMVMSGAVVLLLMRWCWPAVTTWSENVFGRQADVRR
jgi:uncharacterized hydrophobic protein (TIGR00271 family)